MTDTKQLTIKEMQFVDAFMETGSNSQAYKFAYDVSKMKDATIHNSGYQVANRPHVKREIEARRADLAERCQVKQEDILKGLFKIIDDYNEGVRLAKSKKKADNSAGYRIAHYVNSSSVVSALKTIAEMTGHASPTPTAINNGVIINIVQPTEQKK